MLNLYWTQVAESDPTREPLLWESEERTHVVRAPGSGEDSDGNFYNDPGYYETYKVVGIKDTGKYSNISQFPAYSGCTVQDNKIMRPDYDIASITSTAVAITGTGGTRVLTTKEVEGFSIVISVPGLYKVSRTEGYLTHEVVLAVFYRVYTTPSSTAPWVPIAVDYKISGKQRAEILKTIPHSKTNTPLPLAQYEILVVRITEDHTGNMDYADDIYIKEINEIVYSKLAYNHTALLGVKIRATDQLSGQLPTVTSLVKGVKVAVPSNLVNAYKVRYVDGNYNKAAIDTAYSTIWNGQLGTEKVWTDNPVWCLYDLLTNDRYGLADYYKISSEKIGLMRANFYLMAKYCDEAVSYTDTTGAQPVPKWRPRFACNIVLDQSKTAAEWIGQFAAIMRGVVYYAEGLFWIDIDRPKPITQLFNMSNIKDFTQSATSYKQIPNSYEVQWINPLTNYEIDAFKLESTELQTNPTIEERKKALMLVGVTNMDQAKAVAKYALLAGQYRTKLVSFKTGTEGLRCSVADIIGIQHDVPQWGFGGEIRQYNAETQTLSVFPAIPLRSGEVYSVYTNESSEPSVRSYPLASISVSDDYTELPLATSPLMAATAANAAALAGNVYNLYPLLFNREPDLEGLAYWEAKYSSGTSLEDIASQFMLAEEYEPHLLDPFVLSTTFILNTVTNAVAQFKVNGIKRDTDELCEITAVEYDPTMFAYCDDTSDLGEYVTTNYSLISNPKRVSVQGVFVSNKQFQTNAGVWATGVEIFYDIPQQSFWKAAQVHYMVAGTGVYTSGEVNSSGYFFIPDLPAGDYQFVVTSVYTIGKQTISDALADYDAHPWALFTVVSFDPSAVFVGGVSGLAIENKANDGTFIGRDCIVTWRAPLVSGADADAGTEVAGAGTTNTSSLVREYIVEVFGRSGEKKRTANIPTTRFVYTYEMNYQDSVRQDGDADREFTISVTAVDHLGRKSAPSRIACSNPAPEQIA